MNALQLMQDYALSLQEEKAVDEQMALMAGVDAPTLLMHKQALAAKTEQVERALDSIHRARWRAIIRMYYVLGYTQERIAVELGLSLRQTARIFRAVKERLRHIEIK
ncbi:MAG: hypothetical protein Q4C54_07605 [Clostridia bacterium]|nr:hypothetical protein [Clostridia bacterium]